MGNPSLHHCYRSDLCQLWLPLRNVLNSYLIPTLNRSCDGIENDSEVQCSWMLPTVGKFMPKDRTISVVQLDDVLKCSWTLCHKSALPHQFSNIGKVIFSRKCINVLKQLVFRNTSQWILDPKLLNIIPPRISITYSPVVLSVIAAILARRFSSSPIKMDALRVAMMQVVAAGARLGQCRRDKIEASGTRHRLPNKRAPCGVAAYIGFAMRRGRHLREFCGSHERLSQSKKLFQAFGKGAA